ncbi:hypothetical protein LCGC14_2881030, partial [marine sediment metagenome]
LGGVTDIVGNAEIAASIASSAVTKESTAPAVVDDWALDMDAGTMTINFNELMDTSQDVDETKITLQETNDTDVGTAIRTLTDSTSAWSDGNTLLVTLSTADKDAILADTGLGVSTVTSYLEIVAASNIQDLVGNALDLTNVTDGASIAASTFTGDSTPPTFTVVATSVHDGGDTIELTFNEAMNVTTITDTLLQADTNITLDYSDNAGDTNAANIVVANATVAWTGNTVATITLDEATDGAYIPDGKYIGVTLASVTDNAGNAEAGSEIYSAQVTKESTAPTYTVAGTSVHAGGDTVVLTFDEVMATATLSNSTGITSITGSASGAFTLANDAGSWNAARTVYTVTLDEATDGDYIQNGETVTVVLGGVTDIVGNAEIAASIASSAVTKE